MKNLLKTFILGVCLSLTLTSFAFAKTNDANLFYTQTENTAMDNVLTEKQKEIDKYLFEDHVKDIAKKGFNVTHTGQIENAVEIGITPFNKENADYLYSIFGKDKVKIVEGAQAQLMDGVVTTTAAVDKEVKATKNSTMQNPLIYGIAIVIILGAAGLILRKRSVKR